MMHCKLICGIGLVGALVFTPASAAETNHRHEKSLHAPGDGHDHAPQEQHSENDGHKHDHAPRKPHAKDDGHDHADKDAHIDGEAKEEPIRITLTPEQIQLIRLRLRPAQSGVLWEQLRLDGEFKLNLDRTARIMPRMPGFVTDVPVKEGDSVKKGDLLARLTSHKLGEYYSAYNSALELEKLTLSDLQMAEKLHTSTAIARRDYLKYKREHADAVIARSRAEVMLRSLMINPAHPGHLHLSDAPNKICMEYDIDAPFAGVVISKNLTVGENFPEDNEKVVLVVSDLKQLWLDLRAPSDDLRKLKIGMTVRAEPVGSKKQFQGKITNIASVIDETTRTGLVRVLVPNPEQRIRAGEFAVGMIELPSGHPCVLVNREAVQMLGGIPVVFVPDGTGFLPREVKVGRTVDGMTQLLSGLKQGEQYVADGGFELKSILLSKGMDPHAGHG
ncbi:MAG: efflux RND transporter periplasmic adaptor subunit, partial [Victivallaceae bacterium]|nr:efflux RND transporter periplasmic adaptor subunit [Victivallaceae bacterium]